MIYTINSLYIYYTLNIYSFVLRRIRSHYTQTVLTLDIFFFFFSLLFNCCSSEPVINFLQHKQGEKTDDNQVRNKCWGEGIRLHINFRVIREEYFLLYHFICFCSHRHGINELVTVVLTRVMQVFLQRYGMIGLGTRDFR